MNLTEKIIKAHLVEGEMEPGKEVALKIDQVHWVGLSMGGMMGQGIALKHPDRLTSLVLSDTGAIMPDEAQPI